jgi:hypothetical protein
MIKAIGLGKIRMKGVHNNIAKIVTMSHMRYFQKKIVNKVFDCKLDSSYENIRKIVRVGQKKVTLLIKFKSYQISSVTMLFMLTKLFF